jgi:hypothetical protein
VGDRVKAEDFKFLRHPEGIDCRDLQKYLEDEASYKKNIHKDALLYLDDINI